MVLLLSDLYLSIPGDMCLYSTPRSKFSNFTPIMTPGIDLRIECGANEQYTKSICVVKPHIYRSTPKAASSQINQGAQPTLPD